MARGRAKQWWASVVALTSLGVACGVAEAQSPTTVPGRRPTDRRPAPPTQIKPATTDELRVWIEQLGSDRFIVREQAMANLIAAGPVVIEPLLARAATGDLETVTRTVHVLRELALAHEQDSVEEAARAGLEAIAAGRQVAAGHEAAATLESLNEIRQRRTIEELERLGAKLSNSNIQFGFQVENVTTVEIGPDWRGEVADLRRLKWLYAIQHAKFSGVRINDEWLKSLGGMQNLTTLTLKHTSVTEDGLAAIRNLPRLDSIFIWYSPIGDRAVDHLKTLKQARMVKLYGTKITKEGVERLEAAWGGMTKIDFRRGGFLGVQCQAHPLGCEVIIVQDNSAAKDGGLEASDIILKYGDKRVESFETLTKHISDNAPGDVITLEIVRNVRLRQQGFVRGADAKLGVTGKSTTLGIEVTKVEPDSFASELGLKPGDVITACDEARVFDLPALEAAFAATKVGEEVLLDYVRAPVLVTKKVKLGEWQ